LCTLPGVGEWTAQYIAMRVLRESDAFLASDVALQRILAVDKVRPDRGQLLARAEAWRPWRAYATLHFWTSEVQQESAKQGERNHAIAV
ncbi:MAG: 3-methyladenine DNA glycosylase 2, partial [Pirellulaceae bacterium]|nr:3-methyladenine DNA glycosylase 2 [Pirellulaceae bacterium]